MKSPYQQPMVAKLSSKPRSPWILKPTPIAYFYEFWCRAVLSSLSDGTGNRILKLLTPFGGGKSHTLASLFHAARNRKALDVLPEGKPLPKAGKVNTAVFDGQFFSPANGKDFPNGKGKAHTIWGWIAW